MASNITSASPWTLDDNSRPWKGTQSSDSFFLFFLLVLLLPALPPSPELVEGELFEPVLVPVLLLRLPEEVP
jgi:hypothetical protein